MAGGGRIGRFVCSDDGRGVSPSIAPTGIGRARRLPRMSWIGVTSAAILVFSAATPVAAFDFLGLFGSEKPLDANPASLPYTLAFDVEGADKAEDTDIAQALRDASATYKLRREAPTDGDGLMRRLRADTSPMLDALWALGYYDAQLRIFVADVVVRADDESGIAAGAHVADTYRNTAVVPIKVSVALGPLFKLSRVIVDYPRDDAPDVLPRLALRLKSGDAARSSSIRTAQVRLVDWFRARSHPLAKIADMKAVVDHADATMDLRIVLDPGPRAGIGDVTITGTKDVPTEVVASHVYLDHGEPYAPERMVETKKSIARLQSIGGVRIREGEALDANGNLPVFVEVSERPRNLVGAAVRYSTLDGPGLLTYYEHRNLFGGGEFLRLEGDVSLLQRIDGTSFHGLSNVKLSDFGARVGVSFVKPGLFGSRNDLLIDATANRQRVGNNTFGGYTGNAEGGTVGIIHRFSDTISAQGGIQGKHSISSDVLGTVDARLIGITTAAHYDDTDNLLDPTRGVRAVGGVNAYGRAVGSSIDLVEVRGAVSTYYALDEDGRYVLAGRLAAGTLAGTPLAGIPSEERFYSGGGGSVRGFTYGTISPLVSGRITGGRSLLEGSAEARVKITQTIGVVPFIDAGGAFRATVPNFKDYVGIGAGIGLRYLTPIGPIRLDVATPVNRRPGDGVIAAYVSIGQAF